MTRQVKKQVVRNRKAIKSSEEEESVEIMKETAGMLAEKTDGRNMIRKTRNPLTVAIPTSEIKVRETNREVMKQENPLADENALAGG